jgi:DNA-binding LacI/PurR family transcriptional regulator
LRKNPAEFQQQLQSCSYAVGMTRRLAEVAAKVGVSTATVSRVLNGKQGVSEPTRQAVLTALDVLGYERPTQLRGERSRLVGLVVPELQNPIFPAFAEVAGGALVQQGFTPVLCTQTVGGVQEAEYVELMLQRQASGMLFIGGLYALKDSPHGHYALLSERKLPTVLVNAAVEGLAFPRVSCDDAVAVEQSIAHLRHLGHTEIGLILGVPDHMPSRRRYAAVKALAAKDGFVISDDQVVHSLFSVEGGQAAAAILIDRGMTALICASDPIALGAVRAVRRAGLSVPHDVSVIGYDDSALMMCTDPPLTTVRQPIEPMARAAVDLLVGQINGGTFAPTELFYEPELVVRASSAPAPARAAH